MVKNKVYKVLIIVVVVCLSFIFAIMVLNVMSKDDFSDTNFSEADFPLEIDLPNTVFNVGDKISGTVTITNRSGKNVEIRSNGAMPCTYLHSNNDTSHNHPEMRGIKYHVLKAYDKMSRDFEWEAEESGTYVLYVHYTIVVNGVELRSELDDIIIEVR